MNEIETNNTLLFQNKTQKITIPGPMNMQKRLKNEDFAFHERA